MFEEVAVRDRQIHAVDKLELILRDFICKRRGEIDRKRDTFDANNNSVKVSMADEAKRDERKVQPPLLHLHGKRDRAWRRYLLA